MAATAAAAAAAGIVIGGVEDPHEESIKVCCRFRPENQLERDHNGRICVEIPAGNTTVHVPNSDHTFVFDRVFRWDAKQNEVYDYAAKPIINAVLRGFNGTVFAYGQTSSGKTYTMEGPDIEDKVYQGVIPRMVWSIFDGIYHADDHIEFVVKVSIVEIYNERIRDLLDSKKDNLKVHEDKARGVFIGDVTESYVGCEQEIFDAMRAGHYNRSMAVTNMNEHSSRSHLVFMLTVEQKNLHDRSVKVGKLHLVDLAGSEKVAKTGASGERLDEAKNINRSLSALGNVINALTDKKYTHVPYRDSKLTRVLQESLGGNAKTSLIITCSPSNFNEQETISTLRFGQRAKMIKNVVKVNHERSAEELKLLLEKKDVILMEVRLRSSTLEHILRCHGIAVPEDSAPGAYAEVMAQADQRRREEDTSELYDQLQDCREQLRLKTEQITELYREREGLYAELDECRTLVKTNEKQSSTFSSQISDAKELREQVEYDCNERADEVVRLRHELQRLQKEIKELHRNRMVAGAPAVGGAGGAAGAGLAAITESSASLQVAATTRGSSPESSGAPSSPRGFGALSSRSTALSSAAAAVQGSPADEERYQDDRHRDADRPLKRKVSQLDKNLEQLTVMYHKLVAQNSGLKVEVSENDKKIQRKDQRINQLERNLREAKQKYEKLLTQCANLTSAMDVMERTKGTDLGGVGNGGVVRPKNIVRPMRGGLSREHTGEAGPVAPGAPPPGAAPPEGSPAASPSASAGAVAVESPASSSSATFQPRQRRDNSRTRPTAPQRRT